MRQAWRGKSMNPGERAANDLTACVVNIFNLLILKEKIDWHCACNCFGIRS